MIKVWTEIGYAVIFLSVLGAGVCAIGVVGFNLIFGALLDVERRQTRGVPRRCP